MKAIRLLFCPEMGSKFKPFFLVLLATLLSSVGALAQLHNQANLDYLQKLSTKSSLTETELNKVRATMLAINNEARLNPNYRKLQGCKTALQLPGNLQPLTINDDLNKLAQEQADYQASIESVTHDNRNYRNFGARVDRYLKNHPKPEACAGAMNLSEYPIGWMKSETHYRPTWNLDTDSKGKSIPVNVVGYGVAKKGDMWYFTAIWSFVADPEAMQKANKGNLAFGKPARQSSEYQPGKGYGASKAVDGVTKGDLMNVAATSGAQSDWWEVDLGDVYDIDRVVIWNRTDCCWDRLQNFTLLVSESPITTTNEVSASGGKYGPLSPWNPSMANHAVAVNRRGRYVRVAGGRGIALAEVQVFGRNADPFGATSNPTTASTKQADPQVDPFAGRAKKTEDGVSRTVCGGKTYTLDKSADIYDGSTKIGYGVQKLECVDDQLVATVRNGTRLKYDGQPMKWSPAPSVGNSTSVKVGTVRYQSNMKPGDKLMEGEVLRSPNGTYQLRGTNDGDFVIEEVQSGRVFYTFPLVGPINNPPRVSVFNYGPDGNICISSKQNKGYCATNGRDTMAPVILYKSVYAQLNDDGRLVLVNNKDDVIWQSTTRMR